MPPWITGLLAALLTVSQQPVADPSDVYRRVAETRLGMESSSFAERVDLVRFLDRAIQEVQGPELAELEFLRLRALDHSIKDIPGYEPEDPAHREWIAQHENELAFSEPAGRWLLVLDLFWRLESKHRGRPIAEDIAWAGARNGLPGECEGYIPCYFAVFLMTEARYLELYPSGSHVQEALDAIDFLLVEALKPGGPYVSDPQDPADLDTTAAELTAILQKTADSRKAEMIQRIAAIVQRYRN